MEKITTIATLALSSGIIALTGKQAKPRAHCLKETEEKIGKNKCYEVIDHIQFKVGEELHIDSVPRSIEKFVKTESDESDTSPKPKNPPKKTKTTNKKKKPVDDPNENPSAEDLGGAEEQKSESEEGVSSEISADS